MKLKMKNCDAIVGIGLTGWNCRIRESKNPEEEIIRALDVFTTLSAGLIFEMATL